MTKKNTFKRIAFAVAIGMLFAEPAVAQLSTATIRGQITQSGSPATANISIVAVNTATGARYKGITDPDGRYVLVGLAPGTYELHVADGKVASSLVTVSLGQTAALDLAMEGASGKPDEKIEKIYIVGGLSRNEVKSSEVNTSVSRKQIENLPQMSRNFLAFADLAPGVRFDTDASGIGKIQSGAQNQDNVNVFIDGVSQKNYILRGGVTGLDASRGNPFPQSALAEYKVISQNYKAEFDQVSSAAITAVTKSGTNQFHGELFFDQTSDKFSAYSPFEKENRAKGNDRAAYKQNQYGVSIGGAIKEDVAHYFLSYEGKRIETPRNVSLANVSAILPNAGQAASFYSMQGSRNQVFNEDLLFGKIDLEISDSQRMEISARIRREKDLVAENYGLSAPGNDKERINDETRLDVKHTWTSNQFQNEARVGYENYVFNPRSSSNDPLIKYFVSPTNTLDGKREVIWTGGSPDAQYRRQSGLLFQDDLTYNGWQGHSVKGGAKFKAVDIELSGTSRSVDVVNKLINNKTGDAIVGLSSDYPAENYFQIDKGLAPVAVKYRDNQFGLYLQDDWQVSKQLELNLGVRWDYETNMLNNSYVTPADRSAIFNKQDPRDGAPLGQTYAQSLAKGGVDISGFISSGNRKPFARAIAPRLGFSYDVTGDRSRVIFGGIGRSYDRTLANHALDELQHNMQAGGEIWLVKNDYKMPFTDQLSIGLRQALGAWNGEVGATYSHSKNQFNWYGGNRDPNGGWGTQSPIDPLWGSVPGFGTLILGDFISQAKTTTVYLKMDKPYTSASGWAAGVTYTFSDGQTTNKEWTNDIFNWTYGRSTSGWNPSKDLERHRLVASAFSDNLLPWGLMMSGKLTLGSGLPHRITDCSKGFNNCVSVKGDGSSFRQLDFGLAKNMTLGIGKLIFRLDVANLLNTVNYGGADDWGGGPGNPQNYLGGDNVNLGKYNGLAGPMRTVKLSVRYLF
ncbi:MAG: TonB-dependent receptor [Burkholderiales bacterium]|nr:TonB-dependent receptor [Burkholderiales bacterium]